MSAPGGRVVAVDALRGATIAAMILVNNPGSWAHVYAPLRHAEWHGWTPTDLVFPFFLFLVGCSIVFALQKRIDAAAPRGALVHKILVRGGLLVAIGIGLGLYGRVLDGVSAEDFATLRLPGVLQRIGICYTAVALLYLRCRPRTLAWIGAACLLGYQALMMLVPVPEYGAGRIDEPGTHLAAWIDREVLGRNHLWGGRPYDPEGLLSTIPALATTLLGVCTGRLLIAAAPVADKVLRLFVRGSLLVVAGYVWGWWFPINKPIWTSSYAVFTAGQAMCALALIAYATDVRGWRRWARPLEIYGVNALTVFVMSAVVARTLRFIEVGDGVSLRSWIYDAWFLSWADGEVASLAFALAWVGGWFVVLWAMWRRGVVIKL